MFQVAIAVFWPVVEFAPGMHKVSWFLRYGLWFVFLALVACQATDAPAPDLPTPLPQEYIPTAVALTLQAVELRTPSLTPTETFTPHFVTLTPSRTPTRTPYPTSTPTRTPWPSRTPTPTLTPTPSHTPSATPTPTDTPRPVFPAGRIRLISPGPLSRVTSPIRVRANLAPGAGGRFRVELLGEDGRLLARKVLRYRGERVNLSTDLPFEIPGAAETGRLQISTYDAYGRVLALQSVEIVLLSLGPQDIHVQQDLRENVLVLEPPAGASIRGGTLLVSGRARTASTQPLLISLVTPDGKVVGERLAALTPEPGEDYASFLVTVPYRVQETVTVRLTVTLRDGRIPGATYITTQEIEISP